MAEEEATTLRFYVDQPAFTDLHWVSSIFLFPFLSFRSTVYATCMLSNIFGKRKIPWLTSSF